MTIDECHSTVQTIRRRQGTRRPLVRIDCGGIVYRGRLAKADSDPEHRKATASPFGLLVLEGLGLGRGPETILQIGNIPAGGIAEIEPAEAR